MKHAQPFDANQTWEKDHATEVTSHIIESVYPYKVTFWTHRQLL